MRYIQQHIAHDLQKKMVFVAGPRQCGKTTLAKRLLAEGSQGQYYNWDRDEDREALISGRWQRGNSLVVFDELHKFPRWKRWLKGHYDTREAGQRFLVTGSARLDVYRRGGDSMLGRYHMWRLHPFCLGERPVKMTPAEALRRLLSVGGFPEPFLDNEVRAARRWRSARFSQILRDDVRDLEPLRSIATLQLFADALRRRVGGLVVVSNIAADLQVSPKTVKHWLEVLERMYLCFTVRPLTAGVARAVLKPPKVYFYDNMDVIGDEGARFENLVANHLLKRIQFLEDREGYKYELRYIRDKEGREVDFAILRDGTLVELVEAKLADPQMSPALRYHAERLKPTRARQVVKQLRHSHSQGLLTVQSVLDAFSQPIEQLQVL